MAEALHGSAARDWIAVLSYTPVLILALFGLALSRSAWRRFLPVYAYVAAFAAAYTVFLPTTRYRLPLDFFLIIFAAYTLRSLIWRHERGSRPSASSSTSEPPFSLSTTANLPSS